MLRVKSEIRRRNGTWARYSQTKMAMDYPHLNLVDGEVVVDRSKVEKILPQNSVFCSTSAPALLRILLIILSLKSLLMMEKWSFLVVSSSRGQTHISILQ